MAVAPTLSAESRAISWQKTAALFAMAAVVYWQWESLWFKPMRVLVVLFHELGHALAAVLTGGVIEEIHVGMDEGGHCVTRGGNRFLILSSGYLGSLAIGATILLLASRTKASLVLARGLGALLVIVAFVYMLDVARWQSWAFTVLAGAVLYGVTYLHVMVPRLMLMLIGLTSCLYAVADIKDDVLVRAHPQSDAAMLEQLTGVPARLWGVLWIGISVVVGVVALRASLVASRKADVDLTSDVETVS